MSSSFTHFKWKKPKSTVKPLQIQQCHTWRCHSNSTITDSPVTNWGLQQLFNIGLTQCQHVLLDETRFNCQFWVFEAMITHESVTFNKFQINIVSLDWLSNKKVSWDERNTNRFIDEIKIWQWFLDGGVNMRVWNRVMMILMKFVCRSSIVIVYSLKNRYVCMVGWLDRRLFALRNFIG